LPGESISTRGRLPHGAFGVLSSSPDALTRDRRCPGQSGRGKSCNGERSPSQSPAPHGRGPAPELMQPGWRSLGMATRCPSGQDGVWGTRGRVRESFRQQKSTGGTWPRQALANREGWSRSSASMYA
jgi:hypothetical protein